MPVVEQSRPPTTTMFPTIILVGSGIYHHSLSQFQPQQQPQTPLTSTIHCGWQDTLAIKSGFPAVVPPPPPNGFPVVALPHSSAALKSRLAVSAMPTQQPQPLSADALATYGQRVQRAIKALTDQLQQPHQAHHREHDNSGDDGGSSVPQSEKQSTATGTAAMPAERLLDLSRIGVDSRTAAALCDAIRATFFGTSQKDAHLHQQHQQLGLHLTGVSLSHNALLDSGVIAVVRTILGLSSPTATSSPLTPSMFSQVTCLDLFGVGLTDAAIPPLIDAIAQASSAADRSTPTHITKLKLGDNAITGQGIQMISAGLWGPLRGLSQLHVGGNPIDGSGLHALAAAWTSAPHSLTNLGLRDIKMSGADSTSRGLTALLRALGQPCASGRPQLRELQLRGTPLQASAVEAFSCGFRIQSISNHGGAARPPGSAVPAFLCPCEAVQCLDLTACEMTDAVCGVLLQQIFAGLTVDRVALSLRELHLSSNRLGTTCAASLGQILSAHPTALLSLPSHVPWSHNAATAAAVAAPPQLGFRGFLGCPLTTLNVADAALSGHDIAVLFDEWHRGTGNCNLNYLNLSGNVVSQAAADAISRILRQQHVSYCYAALGLANGGGPARHNHSGDAAESCSTGPVPRRVQLSTLVLANCHIDSSAATTLFDTLACFPGRLRVLELPQNRLGNAATPSLCRMLQENHVVAKLQLQDNGITELRAMEAIEVALAGNPTVRSISIGGQSALANNLSADMRARLTANCERNKRHWLGSKQRDPQHSVSVSRRSSQTSLHSQGSFAPAAAAAALPTVEPHESEHLGDKSAAPLFSNARFAVSDAAAAVEGEITSTVTVTSLPLHDSSLGLPDLFSFLRA